MHPQHNHGPHAHGPHAHGPRAHGPHAHGPHPHGPQMRWRGRGGPRRPLRFLARRLGLAPEQLATVSSLFEDLRTERAQADVDRRRANKLVSEAFAAATFDTAKAEQAAADRAASAGRLQTARLTALGDLHAALTPEQRAKLAVMLRSGPLAF
ncbi:MAG: Spy/CpxP family protein refolding chaperone [Myxococcota bacterium]|jgi:Spy/CpxP family protein refolding chaperone